MLSVSIFFKKTYKLFSVVLFVFVFFGVYNRFLVDRTLINLSAALNKAAQAQTIEDFEKIKPLLKIPLFKEVSKTDVSTKVFFSMEMAENIITTAKDAGQLEDIKFYLESALGQLQKGRGGILSFLDQINSRIFAPAVKLPPKKLEAIERGLLAKIKATSDIGALQRLYYDLGNIYTQLANLPQAEEAFLKAIQLSPKSDLAIKAKFNLAWSCKILGEHEKAVTYFSEVSKEYAQKLSITSQYEIADALYKKGEYQKSSEEYARLAGEYPEFDLSEFALYEAGYISFYNLNDREAALKYFSKLKERFPKAKVVQHTVKEVRPAMAGEFRREGYRLLSVKMYDKAIENFQKAVEIASSDGRSLSGMGLGFYWLGSKPEAVYKAKQAIEVQATDEIILINSLFIYINSGMLDEAISLGEEVISKTLVPRAEFYYNLAYAYILKGRMNEAILQLGRSVRINPDFIFAYNNLGCAFWGLTKYIEGIQKFREAIDRDYGYADAHYNLGIAFFYLNRLEEAYKEFKAALDIDETCSEAKEFIKRITETLKYQP